MSNKQEIKEVNIKMSEQELAPYREFARERLGFEFKDVFLLVTALTHRSYVNEHKKSSKHNERLEFLGDAVLELVTSDFLYKNFERSEGVMTSWRSSLVRTESIGAAGEELGYGPLVRMSKGEAQKGSERAHASIMADCFEAVIGAIYLDQGYEAARKFIEKHILVKMDQILEEGNWKDPKSQLQELAQRFDTETPIYKTLREEGPDHDKTFTVGVYVGETLKGKGSGHSKQEAQVNAAIEGAKSYRELLKKK